MTCSNGLRRNEQNSFRRTLKRKSRVPAAHLSPDENVGVEQKFHSWPSQNSSGKGSSKSSLVEMAPRLRPATRFFLECATTGTRRATGVPCSVIITSLPARASASKSGNLFCASSTLTVWVMVNSSQRLGSIALSKGPLHSPARRRNLQSLQADKR